MKKPGLLAIDDSAKLFFQAMHLVVTGLNVARPLPCGIVNYRVWCTEISIMFLGDERHLLKAVVI
jgi:hypothetical protein